MNTRKMAVVLIVAGISMVLVTTRLPEELHPPVQADPCPYVRAQKTAHAVTLTGGQIICSGLPTMAYVEQVAVGLPTVSGRKRDVGDVRFVVGNHTEVLSTEKVATPLGPATLAYVVRTPPAAAAVRHTWYEYWLVGPPNQDPDRTDMEFVRVIRAIDPGDANAARNTVLELSKTWRRWPPG